MKKIYNAENDMEARYLVNLLQSSGIPAYFQESGSGEYLKITSGMNLLGTDLYVNDEDASSAKQIVKDAIRDKKKEQNDSAAKIPWYQNRTILARIILVWGAISVAAVVILSIF